MEALFTISHFHLLPKGIVGEEIGTFSVRDVDRSGSLVLHSDFPRMSLWYASREEAPTVFLSSITESLFAARKDLGVEIEVRRFRWIEVWGGGGVVQRTRFSLTYLVFFP